MVSFLEASLALVCSDGLTSRSFSTCLYMWGDRLLGCRVRRRLWYYFLSISWFIHSLLRGLRKVVLSLSAQAGEVFNSETVRNNSGLCSVQSVLSVVFKQFVVLGEGVAVGKSAPSVVKRHLWSILVMAPRQRGTPRRGGVSGRPTPPCISSLAMASPASSPSEESRPSLNSSLHTARFTFKSKRHQPLISAIITVIFSEVDEEQVSAEADSGNHGPSQEASATRRGLGDVTLKVSATMQEAEDQGDPGDQVTPHPDNVTHCAPADRYATYLYPVLPPGVKMEDIGEGVMLDWLLAPDEDNDKVQGEPPKA